MKIFTAREKEFLEKEPIGVQRNERRIQEITNTLNGKDYRNVSKRPNSSRFLKTSTVLNWYKSHRKGIQLGIRFESEEQLEKLRELKSKKHPNWYILYKSLARDIGLYQYEAEWWYQNVDIDATLAEVNAQVARAERALDAAPDENEEDVESNDEAESRSLSPIENRAPRRLFGQKMAGRGARGSEPLVPLDLGTSVHLSSGRISPDAFMDSEYMDVPGAAPLQEGSYDPEEDIDTSGTLPIQNALIRGSQPAETATRSSESISRPLLETPEALDALDDVETASTFSAATPEPILKNSESPDTPDEQEQRLDAPKDPRDSKMTKIQDSIVNPPHGLTRRPFFRLESTHVPSYPRRSYVEAKIRIGDDFQAEIPDEPYRSPEEDPDKEESLWTPPIAEKINPSIPIGSQDQDIFYRIVRDIYWRAIWRQFEGRIPFETALQVLMEHNYNFGAALESIDLTLEDQPQRFKPISTSQAKTLKKRFQDWEMKVEENEKVIEENSKKTAEINMLKELGQIKRAKKIKQEKVLGYSDLDRVFDRRLMQKKVLRNYHLGEIHNYLHQFQRFYVEQKNHGVPCNCADMICNHIKFEPRWGCLNCTKQLRDTSEYPSEAQCLICQTYWHLEHQIRPALNPQFDDEELDMIGKWDQKEAELGRKLKRAELEDILDHETKERHRNGILTNEERIMIKMSELPYRSKKELGRLTEEEKAERGEKLVAALEPVKLPLFTRCSCKESGAIYRGSRNEGKMNFSKEEEKEYCKTLEEMNGNIKMTAEALNVEQELVERFLDTYDKNNSIWKNFPNNDFHNYPIRGIVPPTNLPPVLPEPDEKPIVEELETQVEKVGRPAKRSCLRE